MRLITVLISLGVEHFCPQLTQWRDDKHGLAYQEWWASKLTSTSWWNAITAILFPIVPVMLVLCGIYWLVGSLLFGLVAYILDALVLWYVLRNTWTDEISYDKTVFSRAHDERFAVLFWFFIFGVWAIVLYRMLTWMRDSATDENNPYHVALSYVSKAQDLIAWIPARLTALSYALVGNFAPAFTLWKERVLQVGDNGELLTHCGEAALDEREHHAVESLIQRASLLWLFVFAVVTIGMLI